MKKLLSICLTAALILSCFVGMGSITATAGTTADLQAAAEAYLLSAGNTATAAGLLTAVQAVEPGATLDTANDYYFKHAVPGVKDDTVDYPLDIPGSDGALVAVFEVNGDRYPVAVPLAHETETIAITETAIVGTSTGFTYDENGNVTGYSGTANKIVLPADYNGTFLRITDQTSVDNVKVLIYNNKKYVHDYAFYDWDGLVAVQFKSGEAAWRLTGNGSNHNDTRGFASCDNLKYVRLPDIVSLSWYTYVLHNNMFDGCGKLENLSHPSLSTSSNKTTSWAAYNGTAIRDYVFPQYYASGSNSSNPTFQQYSAASPTVPVATRNVHWYTDAMTTPRAVALAVSKGNELVRDGVTGSELTNGMLAAITGSADAETVAASISMTGVLERVTLTIGGDTYQLNYKRQKALPDTVVRAADAYVKANCNDVTAAGLLAAVRAAEPSITLDAENNFYIKHAVPGVKDDTVDYPLSISGSDGAVAAIFKLNGAYGGYTCAFSHETETIAITETAIVGTSTGFTYDENGNVTGYSGTADKIVLPADYNGTFLRITDQTSVDNVKVLIYNNKKYVHDYAFYDWDGLVAVQFKSGEAAWKLTGNGSNHNDTRGFASCDNLKYVRLPDIVSLSWYTYVLHNNMFEGCGKLENLSHPSLSTSSNKTTSWAAYNGTAIRDYVFPQYYTSGSNSSNPTFQQYSAASPTVPAATRNVHWYTDAMTFVRAAALAAAKANELSIADSISTSAAAETAIKGVITGSADAATFRDSLTYDWNAFSATAAGVSAELVLTDTEGDSIPIQFSFDSASFKSHSLVLTDQIGVNFFMDLSDLTAEEKANSYMTFAVTHYNKTLRDNFNSENVNGAGYYRFTCLLTSVEMAETIVPTFHFGDGSTLTGNPFSVKEYIDYVVEHSESFSDNVVLLVRALGDYGHYAQIYLGNKNRWTAGTDYTVMPKYRASDYTTDHYSAYLGNLSEKAMVKNITDSAVTRVSYNLNFGTNIYININLTSEESLTASALVAGERIEAKANGTFRTQGLMITKLGDRFTLTGTGSSNTTPFSVTLSGLSYIRSILNKETESVVGAKNAVASLYDYYNAAMSYITYNESLDGEDVSE